MKHGKDTSNYMNIMKYAKHADKITKITTKYYRKLLNSNHYQTIIWKVSITDIHYRLHVIVNIT